MASAAEQAQRDEEIRAAHAACASREDQPRGSSWAILVRNAGIGPQDITTEWRPAGNVRVRISNLEIYDLQMQALIGLIDPIDDEENLKRSP